VALAETFGGFPMPRTPVGLLLLNHDPDVSAAHAAGLADAVPELRPARLSPEEVIEAEPSLRPGPSGVWLATGFPIPPASATSAWASLAEERGARLRLGVAARPVIEASSISGVALADGDAIAADAVLVAAGPWSPLLVDPGRSWDRIRPIWGVTLQLRLDSDAPHAILEEDEVDTINRAAAATERAAFETDGDPPSLFSLASANGLSTLGSTFLPSEPDPVPIGQLLLRRATEFLPAVQRAEVVERRLCARPQSVDGLPFIGPVDGVGGLFVCAGHGPWGISTGPGSAAMAARSILDGTRPPPELEASRPIG
jgi:glycine/D-amino acid oxidase-like deaminating enzyme